MLQLISNKDCVIELLEPSGDITIKIGDENYIPEAKDCSVITAEYCLGGRPIGNIGLIGPQRINYSKVISIMAQVIKEENYERAAVIRDLLKTIEKERSNEGNNL